MTRRTVAPRGLSLLGCLLIGPGAIALALAARAAEPPAQGLPPPAQVQSDAQTPAIAASATANASPAPAKVCIDAESSDPLIKTFADRLREAIDASGTLSAASSTADACALQFHIPGNLLRFQTAGGVMVSTVAIVTSSAGRYLSTSISACRESDLQPCALRAVTAARLALLLRAGDGT
jgi:hypothetical protein